MSKKSLVSRERAWALISALIALTFAGVMVLAVFLDGEVPSALRFIMAAGAGIFAVLLLIVLFTRWREIAAEGLLEVEP